MANHLQPTITSTYANFVTEMDARFDDLAVGLDPAVTTATNIPTNSIRWASASNKWQKYNGSAWNDLATTYAIAISGNAGTVTNGVYTDGTYANPAFITSLAGSKITGDIGGNALTATTLANARNINGVSFNGSAAISINLNNSVTFNNAGSGSASGSTFNGGSALTVSYNTIGAPSTSGTNATGSWGISITGGAAQLTTARNIGGVSFNGTANINLPGVNIAGNQNTSGTATNSTRVVTTNWIVEETSGVLQFKTSGGVLKFSMSSTGGFTVH
jgi:hypothetical protein